MTQKRPFTLTITNGNRAQIKAAPTKETPKADNANQFDDRLRARADLSVAYAGILGVHTAQSEVYAALRLSTSTGNVAKDVLEDHDLLRYTEDGRWELVDAIMQAYIRRVHAR